MPEMFEIGCYQCRTKMPTSEQGSLVEIKCRFCGQNYEVITCTKQNGLLTTGWLPSPVAPEESINR